MFPKSCLYIIYLIKIQYNAGAILTYYGLRTLRQPFAEGTVSMFFPAFIFNDIYIMLRKYKNT